MSMQERCVLIIWFTKRKERRIADQICQYEKGFALRIPYTNAREMRFEVLAYRYKIDASYELCLATRTMRI